MDMGKVRSVKEMTEAAKNKMPDNSNKTPGAPIQDGKLMPNPKDYKIIKGV